ncbi:IclR family transcriptional regulator (plasmid) [Paroceanicella profunda]|uniref:IclR family transcriptional regulator n=1 Tax=Paroceanicella profunda TaxID=2579971 RepID=A0A5B8FIH0_9RHOB|nr:IclR family transcriptional regulator [Paroceanicella profunda]QDL93791.1 IclR family transcriptional regulator [Paroceanicella profunda]
MGRRIPGEFGSERQTGTLGKAVDVLEIIASAEGPMRFTDILNVSGQPRGTLHRQLTNLAAEGLVTIDRGHSYSLGLRLLKFASRAWAENAFRAVAEPYLRRLHDATGETVHLAVLSGDSMVYLDKVESRKAVRMHSQIGNTAPLHCTGVGKAALSTLDAEEVAAVVARLDFERFTGNTHTGPGPLLEELARVRAEGVAFDREEHGPGIRCVAAPIPSSGRSRAAGLSVTGPIFRADEGRMQLWARLVREAATEVTEELRARLGPRA